MSRRVYCSTAHIQHPGQNRPGDIRHAEGVLKEYSQTYSEEGLRQSRLWPSGTLCITIAANIADSAILGIEACFPDSVVGFIPEKNHIDVCFVEYFIRTAKENIERFAPATAQKNINLKILSEVAVPQAPYKEQLVIVQKVEKQLSILSRLEKTTDLNLQRADRLRQSILKKAFSGQLIPSNHTYNSDPAIELPLAAEETPVYAPKRKGKNV
ncbi:MAG: hypothetical protein HKM93_17760 [Desulfobacteraceae bacterium]|nr:hypothetical protein [Desulfobacteraceae bacterium]